MGTSMQREMKGEHTTAANMQFLSCAFSFTGVDQLRAKPGSQQRDPAKAE